MGFFALWNSFKIIKMKVFMAVREHPWQKYIMAKNRALDSVYFLLSLNNGFLIKYKDFPLFNYRLWVILKHGENVFPNQKVIYLLRSQIITFLFHPYQLQPFMN